MAEVFVGSDVTGDGVNDADITPSGSFVNIGGVLFTDAANTGSGTGGYNTFLAISDNDGIEQGFNSDDTPPIDASNANIDQAKTHTVLLSDLVIVTVNGVQYYEFRVDLNEANSDPNAQISLDQFKLYSSANGEINDTTTLFGENLIYDMDAGGNKSVLLSDAESSGSGNDDYSVLVPITEFAGLDPTETYIYLFTEMGAAGDDWEANATFEEWNLQNGVTLTGTKFEDEDGDGVRDAGEGPVEGVTIFIDANQNGVLDAGERTTVTDADGNYTFFGVATDQTVWIDEDLSTLPDGTVQTTGDHETVVIDENATPGSSIVVDPIGNLIPRPAISITKDASVDGDCADTVGELITYTIVLDNTGNVSLDTVVLTDAFEGGADETLTVTGDTNLNTMLDVGEVWLSGDTGDDGIMGVDETWTYTFVRAVTQEHIDSNGGGDGTLDNTATANAQAVDSDEAADEVTDDASVDVCQDPALGIDKSATVDGDCADTVGELVNYTILVSNEGNVGLENVVVTDDLADAGSLDNDSDDDGVIDGDDDDDGILDVGETWTYTAFHAVTQEDIDNNGNFDSDLDGTNDVLRNIATANADAVTTGEAADEVTDDASVDVCQDPALGIDKSATVDGDCADTVGELVNYTILVSNEGNVGLENVVVTDDLADAGSLDNDSDDDGVIDGDDDDDGILDVGETWTYTAFHTVTQEDIDNNGNFDSDLDGTNDVLRNIATANADAVTTGEAADEVTDDATVDVCQDPALGIDKSATVDGDCVDTVGELVNYTILVSNEGNVGLENVVVTDDLADAGSLDNDSDDDGVIDGDDDDDGILDVGETWTYTAFHTVTQEDIDNNGNFDSDLDGTNDVLRNIATANADAVTTGEAADEVTDDATVDVCQDPLIDVEKFVMTDVNGVFADEDDPDGPAASTSSTVDFKVVVTNTGNVTLTDVALSDSVVHTVGGVPGAPVAIDYSDPSLNTFIDLNDNATLDVGEEWANFDTNGDGTLDVDENGDPFELSVGESFTIYYSLTSELGQHENTAEVTAGAATTGETATDADDANYFVLATDDCVGVRTPGFWSNSKWGLFWNLNPNNPGQTATDQDALPQTGTPGFASGELLYGIDSNEDGFVNVIAGDGINDGQALDTNAAGLLVGDYNMNGITDAGEDTIFISLANAKTLINASNKQGSDGIYMLGRDVVAAWLNYLANNDETVGECIGGVDSGDGTNTPREYLDAAIDWLQQFASDQNSSAANNLVNSYHDGDTQAQFQFDTKVAPSSVAWKNPFLPGEDIPVSAAAMHAAIDGYNNTGAINGIEYCCDADSPVALAALAQVNLI